MSLLARLQEEMKAAMKGGQKDRLSVLRMVINEVKNIDLQPRKPTEEEAVAAYAKKLRKGVEEMEKVGRAEEAAKLKTEIAVVEEFLPKKAAAGDTAKLVEEFLAAGTYTPQQVGQAIGAFMKQHGAQVDPGIASGLIRQKLAK